jgi:phosphatidylinositol glycan class K
MKKLPVPVHVVEIILVIVLLILLPVHQANALEQSNHTKNVAVILSSSTFYHNYRHTTNALAIYQSLKNHGGFTDDNIILMMADEVACNARNPYKESIFPVGFHHVDLYEDVQVDYTGADVTVDNFFRVLLGRHEQFTPAYQQLLNIDEDTNLFLYATGHGGDSFFKFRDVEDFTTKDLRGVFEQLQIMKRFRSVLFMSDTCQAFTTAPNTHVENDDSYGGVVLENVYSISSSLKDENSYSHHSDPNIGHSVMDRYVFNFVIHMGGFGSSATGKWQEMDQLSLKSAMVDSMYESNGRSKLGANVGWSDLGCETQMSEVPLSDFLVMRRPFHEEENDDESGILLIEDYVDLFDSSSY